MLKERKRIKKGAKGQEQKLEESKDPKINGKPKHKYYLIIKFSLDKG